MRDEEIRELRAVGFHDSSSHRHKSWFFRRCQHGACF